MVRYTSVVLAALVLTGPALAGSWADGLFDEMSKDFGSVPRGPVLSHAFRVKNNTNGVVTLGGVRVSCNRCSSADVLKTTLNPGEDTAVVVKMYTSQFEGVKTIYIWVTFGQPQFDEVRLWVQANSRNDVTLAPDALAFGQARRGSTPSLTTKVTFYGSPQSRITEVVAESNYVQTSLSKPAATETGVTYELTATLRADAPAGKWYTDLWLKTNNAAMPRVRVPLTVEIESALQVSAPIVSLGEVKVGSASERKVIVRGARPFKITALKGADEQVEVRPGSEDSKPVHSLSVQLKGARAGAVSRTIRVITDLKEDGDIEFQVKGQVVP
jgi:hypothetical protein